MDWNWRCQCEAMVFSIVDTHGYKHRNINVNVHIHVCTYLCVCVYANIPFLCPNRGNGSSNTIMLIIAWSMQILVSEYYSPLTESGFLGKMADFKTGKEKVQMNLEHLIVAWISTQRIMGDMSKGQRSQLTGSQDLKYLVKKYNSYLLSNLLSGCIWAYHIAFSDSLPIL